MTICAVAFTFFFHGWKTQKEESFATGAIIRNSNSGIWGIKLCWNAAPPIPSGPSVWPSRDRAEGPWSLTVLILWSFQESAVPAPTEGCLVLADSA